MGRRFQHCGARILCLSDGSEGGIPLQAHQQATAAKGGKTRGISRDRNRARYVVTKPPHHDEPTMEPGWSTAWNCLPHRGKYRPQRVAIHSGYGQKAQGAGVPARSDLNDGTLGGQHGHIQASNDPCPGGPSESRQQQGRQQARHHHHGKSGKTKRPASWLNSHKRLTSSMNQDVADVELWSDEIKELSLIHI